MGFGGLELPTTIWTMTARHDLLESYLQPPPTPAEWSRLQVLAALYDYVCLLWSELYLNLYRGIGPDATRGAAPQEDAARTAFRRVWSSGGAARRLSSRAAKFRHTRRACPQDAGGRGPSSGTLANPTPGNNGESMARMIVVDRDGKEHEIEAKPGFKVMEILRELDYGVAAICGGLCSCATCHVYVDRKLGRPLAEAAKR
jgi:hypothetical protein